MISSNFLFLNSSLPSSNFIANEIVSLQSSYLRLSSDFHATGFKMDNLEKAYIDAIEKLTGMLQRQVQTQKESNNLGCLTSNDTPTTGRNPYFKENTVDTDLGNFCYGVEGDMTEAFIYEEEDCFLDSCNEDFFTAEEFFFAASILDPTYSEICLPSAFADTYDFKMTMESNSLTSNRPAIIYHYRLFFYGICITSKVFGNIADFSLLGKYMLTNKVFVQNFIQYKIFFWDPGTFFFLHALSPTLSFEVFQFQ